MEKKQNKKKEQISFLANFLLGGTSGAISKTLTAPLERIKLLLQNQFVLNNLNKKYNGNIDCFVRVYKEQGVLSFWRGNLANVVRYVPSFALNYSLKEFLNKYFNKNTINNSNLNKIFINYSSGFIASGLTTIVTYPLDFARTRLGVDVNVKGAKKEYRGIIDCIATNYRIDGVRGIYTGLLITIVGGSLYRGCYFGFYDSIKIFMPFESTNALVFYMLTVMTTGFSGVISLPFDTIRRRMMIQTGKKEKYYNGYYDCFKKIYQKEGIKGFNKGGYANFMRSFGSAFTLFFNDHVILYYKNNYLNKGNN